MVFERELNGDRDSARRMVFCSSLASHVGVYTGFCGFINKGKRETSSAKRETGGAFSHLPLSYR